MPEDRGGLTLMVKLGLGALVGLVFLCVVVGGVRHRLHRQIEAELDALRADGFAVTQEEVIAAYGRPPPGPNAAEYWKAAGGLWKQPATADRELVPLFGGPTIEPGAPMSDDVVEASAAFVRSNAAFRQQVDMALGVESCHLGLDLAQGWDLLVQDARVGQRAARMLRLEAVLAARDGRPEEALALLESGLSIGDHLRDEPLVSYTQVADFCDSLMVDGLEDAMHFEIPSDAWLRRLRDRLLSKGRPSPRTLAFENDFRIVREWFADPDPEMLDPPGYWMTAVPAIAGIPSPANDLLTDVGDLLLWAVGVQDADLLACVRLQREYLELLSKPEDLWWPEAQRLDADIQALSELRVVTKYMTYHYVHWVRMLLERQARLRCAAAALAVAEYRLHHGALPERLDALVPDFLDALPPDPFDADNPIRYRFDETGYTLYSIGENGVDDAGSTEPGVSPSRTLDIGFVVE